MLNPDGRLFVERLGRGMEVLADLEAGATEIIIGSLAHALQTEAAASSLSSRVSFQLEDTGL